MTVMEKQTTSLYRLEEELCELEAKVVRQRSDVKGQSVAEYLFADWDGRSTSLAQLFGDRDNLIVIHNMGAGCSYCTMWADGLNGLLPYLEKASAVAMVNHDDIEKQKEVSRDRGWKFRMLDASRNSFFADMGFRDKDNNGLLPGTSTFTRDRNGTVRRQAMAYFGPGDKFCPVFSFLDLLPSEIKDAFEP
jgi:predicted dithiol-disulfide oxidoreductase (DUF899 family)